MISTMRASAALFALSLCLAGCGGSSGGGGVVSTPAPVPTATPTPAPSPTPSPTPSPAPSPTPPAYQPQAAKIFAEPLYNQQLAVVGKAWQHEYVPGIWDVRNLRSAESLTITYDAATGNYAVTAPVAGSGMLMQVGEGNSYPFAPGFPADPSNRPANVNAGSSLAVQGPVEQGARYKYATFIELYASAPAGPSLDTQVYGTFAVGQPTRPGDVPTIGTARYTGELHGYFAGDAGGTYLGGISTFDFDYGRGTLFGQLKVRMNCFMGCYYGDVIYNLDETKFAQGAVAFSGLLNTAGAPSSGTFSGMFVGPDAREMMAQFEMPFFNDEAHRWMTAAGAIIGKRE